AGADAQPAGQAGRGGLPARRRRRTAGHAARGAGCHDQRQRPADAGRGNAPLDGPQPDLRRAGRGGHPGAVDAHQVEPARGTVPAHDRGRRCRAGARCAAAAGARGMSAVTNDSLRHNLVALGTVARREIMRILRIWSQTLVPPAITMTLYFLIFGGLIGSRIGTMDGISYMDFIVPGLVMMSVIQNSYGNISS